MVSVQNSTIHFLTSLQNAVRMRVVGWGEEAEAPRPALI